MDLGKEKEPGTRHASRLSLVVERIKQNPNPFLSSDLRVLVEATHNCSLSRNCKSYYLA